MNVGIGDITKVEWGKNALYALIAPFIHLLMPGKETVSEAVLASIIVYAACYAFMCGTDGLIVWGRKKIHGADA